MIISGMCSVWGDGPCAVPGVLGVSLGRAQSHQAWGEHPSRSGCFSTSLAVAAAVVSPNVPAVPWLYTLWSRREGAHTERAEQEGGRVPSLFGVLGAPLPIQGGEPPPLSPPFHQPSPQLRR